MTELNRMPLLREIRIKSTGPLRRAAIRNPDHRWYWRRISPNFFGVLPYASQSGVGPARAT